MQRFGDKVTIREHIAQQRGTIVTGLFLLVTVPLVSALPSVWRTIFSIPSGVIAAFFLGSAWEITSEGVLLLTEPTMHVTHICSGASFFFLLVALFASLAITRRSGVKVSLLLVPLAYAITVAANVSRLALCWYGRILSQNWLPSKLDAAVHMLIGMMVFLPLLILSYELVQRRVCRER